MILQNITEQLTESFALAGAAACITRPQKDTSCNFSVFNKGTNESGSDILATACTCKEEKISTNKPLPMSNTVDNALTTGDAPVRIIENM